jgi:hypothetical protein
VTHQQNGAFVIGERLLQQVERVHVEIVGRLVEHEQVARLREQLGEQETRALAARQRLHRPVRLPLLEQKIPEIGHDVLRAAVDEDGVAAVAQRLAQGRFGFERFALLVEIDRRQPVSQPHAPRIGRESAGQQPDQRRFSSAVGADDADARAPRNAQ